MKKQLESNKSTGDPFGSISPFVAFLDVYTDGWFVEYALDNESVEDKSTLNWKRWHNQPIQEHGELSRILVYGLSDVLYRFKGGTQGATGYIETVRVAHIR